MGMSASTRNIRRWRRPCTLASIGLAFALSGAFQASAASSAEAARKARHSKIVPTSRAAPDITATIPKPGTAPKAPAPQPKPDDEALPPPFNLPNAPRSKMRACGEQWQAIKLTGRAGSKTWRDFATQCLAGASEPARTIP